MTDKTEQNRDRVNRYRDRQRELGRVQRTVWLHLSDWPRIRKYIDRLNKEREK